MEPVVAIDEKRRIVYLMFLAEFVEDPDADLPEDIAMGLADAFRDAIQNLRDRFFVHETGSEYGTH